MCAAAKLTSPWSRVQILWKLKQKDTVETLAERNVSCHPPRTLRLGMWAGLLSAVKKWRRGKLILGHTPTSSNQFRFVFSQMHLCEFGLEISAIQPLCKIKGREANISTLLHFTLIKASLISINHVSYIRCRISCVGEASADYILTASKSHLWLLLKSRRPMCTVTTTCSTSVFILVASASQHQVKAVSQSLWQDYPAHSVVCDAQFLKEALRLERRSLQPLQLNTSSLSPDLHCSNENT